jgi:hypothetical protein
VREASSQNDINAIKTATQTLQNATYALSQQMYSAEQNAANGGSANPYNGQTEPDDVVEGQFTEA